MIDKLSERLNKCGSGGISIPCVYWNEIIDDVVALEQRVETYEAQMKEFLELRGLWGDWLAAYAVAT